jgi:tRNA pseudouridine55 synthase
MERPLLIDKPLGATPLGALELLRKHDSIPASVKLAYAGRLDPMASGLMLVLHGDQLQRQEEYWYLPKRYSATVLIGVRTDSYDILGMPQRVNMVAPHPERITAVVQGLVGKIYLAVPVYSSYRHEGKPLFAWAKEESDGPPVVPVRRMSVAQIDVRATDTIDASAVREIIRARIPLVDGDFRQDETIAAWHQMLAEGGEWVTVDLDIHCGSGTYVRSLAHELGRRLGGGAVLLDLRRTQVGPWRISDPTVVHFSSPQSAS